MTQSSFKISCKLHAVQVNGYVRYLGQVGYQSGTGSFDRDERGYQLLDELFGMLRRSSQAQRTAAES